ncbi:hypothetical protein AAC387_Pa02g1452 [Persea americana]
MRSRDDSTKHSPLRQRLNLRCVLRDQMCKFKMVCAGATPPSLSPRPTSAPETVDIWCNPPQKHFDLSLPMFRKLGEYQAGIIPDKYHRVPCIKQGGMRFELKGNLYWLLVLVYNVAGAGELHF